MITKEQVGKTFAIAKTAVAVAVAVVQGVELVTAAATASQRIRDSRTASGPRPSGRGWYVDRHGWDYDPDMEEFIH